MNKLYLSLLFILSSIIVSQSQDNYKSTIDKHREDYKMSFLKDSRSPLEAKDLEHLQFYDVNSNLCLKCSATILEQPKKVVMATYSGKEKDYLKYVRFDCSLKDAQISLYGYKSIKHMNMPMYRDKIFIPFKDSTNGITTYGGGRYVDIDMSKDQIDGLYVLDLNKSYNPWCQYADGYNCPIPPKENHLSIMIKAGEKKYTGLEK